MSTIKTRNKISINFHSSGTFLNLNKPKLLSLNKQLKNNIKIINPNNINLNISKDISQFETIAKLTESDNKDEIIKELKNRLSTLEKKIKMLEKEKIENIPKINRLNISHDSSNKDNSFKQGIKSNLKLVKKKNQNNIFKLLNISKSLKKNKYRTIINDSFNNNFMNLNNIKIYNYRNKNNFLSIFNNNNCFNNINTINNNKRNFSIIPRKKFFDKVLQKTLIKYNSIDNSKLQKDFCKNIPKIPRRIKKNKSIIINNKVENYKNSELTSSPELKKISNSEKKCENFSINSSDINEKNKINDFNIEFTSESKFQNIKNKMENIKTRTKNLLEYYNNLYNNQNVNIEKNINNCNIK